MTEPKLKPIAPCDVEMQRQASGDYIAFDTVNKRIISTGFDDENDFEDWKRDYFAKGR